MDKNEYRIKVGRINKLIEIKDYSTALEIAETIDWTRIKNVRMLCLASEIYRKNARYEESREILLQAYEYSPTSRRIIYRLSELCVKLGKINEAIDYYQEFVQVAPNDTNKYILKYKIYRARGSAIEDQIAILEDYKRHEYEEQWAFELAKLYAEEGNSQKAVEECDELILWFSEGEYVLRAMELKQQYKPLTPLQKSKYEAAVKAAAQEEVIRAEAVRQMKEASEEQQESGSPLSEQPAVKQEVFSETEISAKAVRDAMPQVEPLAEVSQEPPRAEEYSADEAEIRENVEDVGSGQEDNYVFRLLKAGKKVTELQPLPPLENTGTQAFAPADPIEKPQQIAPTMDDVIPVEPESVQEPFELEPPLTRSVPEVDPEELEAELADNLREIMREPQAPTAERMVLDAHAAIRESKQKIDQMLSEEYQADIRLELPDDVQALLDKYQERQEQKIQVQKEESIDELVEDILAEEYPAEDEPLIEDNDDAANDLEERIEDGLPDDIEALVETEARAQLDMKQVQKPLIKRVLPEEYHDIFTYFVPVRGMREQLETILENERNCLTRFGTSSVGNILIVGDRGTGKTVLAIDVVKAIHQLRNKKDAKVAKISAPSLNQKQVSEVFEKVAGGALIIEKAGALSEKTINELNLAMGLKTGEMLIILEDTKESLYPKLAGFPEFAKKFTSTIELPVFNNDELIEFAKSYADELEYTIDDMGILALYNLIGNRQTDDHNVTVAEVKDLVDEAIEREGRFSMGKLFRGSKRYDENKRIILREKDFEEE